MEDIMKPKKSERQPLDLEDVIGWLEFLEKRIARMEKLLAQHEIKEPDYLK
jgi:hypothetical protein